MSSNVTPQVRSHAITESVQVVQWFRRFVAVCAADWRWSPLTVGIIASLPLLIALSGVVLAGVGKSFFKWAVGEDGPVENLQVLFYVGSLIMALIVTYRHWRGGDRLMAGLYGILSLGLFVLTGEEISWGQRILGWATPAGIAAINVQDETNLHNLQGIMDLFKWVQLGVGMYGALLPLAVLAWVKSDRLRKLADQLVPHSLLIPYFGLIFVWKLYRNFWPDPEYFKYFLAKYNELMELPLAMGFFFFLVYQMRRSRISTEG